MTGVTSSGKTFSAGFAFLQGEKSEDYHWAFLQACAVGLNPGVLVMDGEEAVKIGAEAVWPNMPTLLCVWHVNMCVQENCKKRAGIYWPAFDQGWCNIQRS